MARPSPASLAGVAVEPGRRVVHRLPGATTHGGFAVDLPLHLLFGAQPGPTLVVHAGLSGLEIEPALTLPGLVAAIDPAALRGNLVVAPLVNLSGFEFEQSRSAWDDVDLNGVGAGRPDGTVSEQLIDAYARTVLDHADALIDVRSGSQWGYYRYAGVHDLGPQERVDASLALAERLGLPHAALGEPVGATLAGAVAARGVVAVTAWVGGGPGLRDHRELDAERLEGVLTGALRHLGMVGGDPPEPSAERVRIHTVLRPGGARGFTFMDAALRGRRVEAGAELGFVRHPFEGHRLAAVTAPRAGTVLHAGASWPVVPEGTTLAILADPI
jgi:uncharacterized protein